MKLDPIDTTNLPRLLKVVANVSTAHLTPDDANILDAAVDHEAFGFIGRFEYGYFLETWPVECNPEAKESGYSDALCRLANTLHASTVDYVVFDRDADVLEGFEIFDWYPYEP